MKKKDILLFLILFVGTVMVFLQFLESHYATDTYNIANVGYENYATKWSLKDGRIFMFLIVMLAGKINLDIKAFSFCTLFVALIISIIAVIVLKNIVSKYKKESNKLEIVLIVVISYFTIFNFMYLENLYFVESVVMAISILLIIMAADQLIRKEKKGFLISLILVILSVFCYQGTIGFYLSIALLLSLIYNKKDIKKVIYDMLKVIAIIGISILLNIILVKVVTNLSGIQQTRIGSLSSFFNNIINIMKNIWVVLRDSLGLFPKYLQIVFILLTCTVFTIYILRNRSEEKINILKLFFLITIIVLSGFATHILSLSSFYTGRLRFSIGSLMGLIYIYMYLSTNIFSARYFKYIISIILCAYSIVTIAQYIIIMNDSKKVNLYEKQDVDKIVKYVSECEKENNVNIDKIVIEIKIGEIRKSYYNDIKSKNVLTYNALKCEWAVDGVINFYSNRKLEKYGVSDINVLVQENEEYKCIDDILYIKVYNY